MAPNKRRNIDELFDDKENQPPQNLNGAKYQERPRAQPYKNGNRANKDSNLATLKEGPNEKTAGLCDKVFIRLPAFNSIQLPRHNKRHTDDDPSTPDVPRTSDPKKSKLTKEAHPSENTAVAVTGSELSREVLRQRLQQVDKDFDLAMKRAKATTHKRKKNDEDIDTGSDESVARFVANMREAAFADIEARLHKKIPKEKIGMLELVKAQLNKLYIHSTFLDNGILESMKLWLEPLSDASLPSLDIIVDILDILDTLPIEAHHLMTSGIERVVLFYTKVDHSQATPAIKHKAQTLVDKWSRSTTKRSEDLRTKTIKYIEIDPQSTNERPRYDLSAAIAPSEE
ncbi:Transcription factor iws1 [Mortierella sp. AD031]|nr:Transcription factor iws1 [Mortierella sp. AD031]